MKNFLAIILAIATMLTLFVACGQKVQDEQTSQTDSSSVISPSENTDTKEFEIYYPSYMHSTEGEKLVLPKKPEKIIVLSNSAMQILVRCNIKPIAFRKAPNYIDFPDWVRELPQIETGMNGLDLEKVMSMEPDLIIMGNHLKKDYDNQLKDANIPVYYTSEGPGVSYPEVKEEAITFARSFGSDDIAKAVEEEFNAVEKRAEAFKASMESKKSMILFGTPPSYQQTSESYLGSILSMLPFENLADTLVDKTLRMAPLDMEKLVEINPEVIFAISPTSATSDIIEKVYKEEFAKNPKIWNSLNAVKNNNVIYLSSEYVTSKGIHIVKSINNLIDLLEKKFEVKPDTENNTSNGKITIEYPKDMQDKGFNNPLVLEKKPERTVVMSKAPVLALHKLGVKMIAIPKGGAVEWPKDLEESTEKLDISMKSNLDIETIIALNPDLVILGDRSKDKYGKILTDANIPVYYVNAGHTVPYEYIKDQTQMLVKAFGENSSNGKEIMARFESLEKELTDLQAKYSNKKVMVLQSSPPSHFIQTEEGTLASMAKMMGFKNVYENKTTSMAPLDMEQAISYNPDLVLCVGGTMDSESHKQAMEEDFAKNPDYWNNISAIKDGKVLYFSSKFISNTGIGFIDTMEEFIKTVNSFYKE